VIKKRSYILLPLLLVAAFATGKDSTRVSVPEKQVCFNMTPLASQLIPFNAINPFTTGPYIIAGKIFSDNAAFRFGAGVNLFNLSNNPENFHLNTRIGYEIRRKITEKWNYSHGCDFILSLGNLNLPGNTSDESNALIGAAPFWSVEYCFGKHVSLSTETSLLIGLMDSGFGGGLVVRFIPPIALYLNLKR
jgi:hypothetical protein